MFNFFSESPRLVCTIEAFNERTKVKESFIFRGSLEKAKKHCLNRQLWELGVIGAKESFKYKVTIRSEENPDIISYLVEDVYIPNDFYHLVESSSKIVENLPKPSSNTLLGVKDV